MRYIIIIINIIMVINNNNNNILKLYAIILFITPYNQLMIHKSLLKYLITYYKYLREKG